MNVFEGGKLKSIKNHAGVIHNINCKEKNYPTKVNSFHNQTISKLGKRFDIIATSIDGEIEAIKHIKYNLLGWMWHPEKEKNFDIKLVSIPKKFFKKI